MSEPSSKKLAAELLAKARARRAKPCVVGRSKHRAVIEEMALQGAGAPLIAIVTREDLGEAISQHSIAKHRKRECLCYRGNAYRDIPPMTRSAEGPTGKGGRKR